MTSVFVRADPPVPTAKVIITSEPLDSVFSKWFTWVISLIIFLMGLIYFSSMFSKTAVPLNKRDVYYYELDNGFNDGHYYNEHYNDNHGISYHTPRHYTDDGLAKSTADVNIVKSEERDEIADSADRYILQMLDDDKHTGRHDQHNHRPTIFTPDAYEQLGGYYNYQKKRNV